ncbi:tyrosine-type recombinase/integrase [Endozoicomonas ascidiicola]|uniref:tyrosine-type recombinase/integrase n=1 Tax=Endozoicomonas ascidiicola TaxID=1698521 RepID=UPI000831B41B|nr:site-specific integrase [Endozoicomonas ascidiicola]
MSRKLYEKDRGNYVGVFPPEGGWQAGRKGLRRKLCPIDELEHLSELDRTMRLTEMYSRKAREISDEQYQKQQERKKKAQRKLWTVKQAKELWITAVKVNRSPKTAKMYNRSLELYLSACGNHEMREYDNDKYLLFLKYLKNEATYRGRKLSDTTVHTHARQLKNFLLFCKDQKIIGEIQRLKMPHLPKQDMRTLTLNDLDKLERHIVTSLKMAEMESDSKTARDMKNMRRAFMLATQLIARLGAIWSLKLDKIDLNSQLIYIRDNKELKWVNKWHKSPDKPINEDLYDFLKKDLAGRGKHEKYFLDKGNGEPWYLNQTAVSRFATKIFKELNLPAVKPFHWGMRATMITELLLQGTDPYAIKELADHDSIETTMLYLNKRKVKQKNAVDGISQLMKNRLTESPKVSL